MTLKKKTLNVRIKPKTFDYQKSLKRRLLVLFGVYVFVFGLILFQLFRLQIMESEAYTQKLNNFTRTFQNISSPRGEIIDRFGDVLVSNQERIAIVYYPPLGMSAAREWELAYRFIDTFEVDTSFLNERDLKDIYLVNFAAEGNNLIRADEWEQYRQRALNDQDIYQLKLSRITQRDLQRLDDRMIQAFVVRQAMNRNPRNSLKIVKDNVSVDEVALLIDRIKEFPGFDINIFFDRSYPYDALLRGLFGSVTTTQQGLISEKLNYYLALGYARNASVGRSGLELQYEALLKGQDTIYEVNYTDDGLATFTEFSMGTKGQDLRLAIDLDLQRHMESVATQAFKDHLNNPFRKYMETIYVVASDPRTGDVLGIVGMKRNGDIIFNNPVATYTEAMAMGSAIKGASMYLGYNENVIRFNEFIMDEPIKIADTPIKRSLFNLGLVNDLVAISRSSNVYMFHIAMRVGGARYAYNARLNIDVGAFDVIRNTFTQFGLGSLTGIDLPNEGVGFIGNSRLGGHLLDFVIGQFDTYTAMQLSQYINTIANDGIRMKPRVVLESTLTNSNLIAYQNTPTILSVLENTPAIKRIQEGFRLCVTDGYCQSFLRNQIQPIAAKTGTAESFMFDENGVFFDAPNSILVSYAPYTRPTISLACAIPHAWNTQSQPNLCLEISGKIYEWYFENR
jgi:cell division protein FtsI/penicillin-binding protein 2